MKYCVIEKKVHKKYTQKEILILNLFNLIQKKMPKLFEVW